MASGRELYADLAAEQLARPEVSVGRMLRSEGLTFNGKVYAFLSAREGLIVKLPADRVAELTSSGTAEQVEMGARRMREWVEVADADERVWRGLVEEAAAYASTLTG